ncbi:hypothetical protein [Ureibacillus sp. FSL W8-0352]
MSSILLVKKNFLNSYLEAQEEALEKEREAKLKGITEPKKNAS